MCGIVAIFSRRTPIPTGAVEKATKSLHHRGPDGQRHWISPDCRTALGHARLSIIDLTTGDQPIANEDERLRIVVNGELYGYESIQKELEDRGHRLRTRSDSEIALHLYEELGADCLRQLRGEFALVIWDDINKRIFAARDRFGIKPLFYSLHDGILYLASEIKALFAAGVPARWDGESVYDSVDFGSSQTRTLFKGIFQVPPGHYMIATEEDIKLTRYWDFDYPESTETAPARTPSTLKNFVTHWTKRFACVSAPMFRWVVTLAVALILVRCWGSPRVIIRNQSAHLLLPSTGPNTTRAKLPAKWQPRPRPNTSPSPSSRTIWRIISAMPSIKRKRFASTGMALRNSS
jgi:asparagine synthase (glutamine-hydrolysing)